MKPRNRSCRVRFPVYRYEVRIIFTADLVATARRLGEKDDVSGAGAVSITLDEHPGVGWLLFAPRPDSGDIAHEAGHAIHALAKAAGTTFDEETYCYHVGHLVERIHKFLKRRA
jgi:hypothetical protein